MRKSRTCGLSPTSGSTRVTSTVIATRGERLVLYARPHLATETKRLTHSARRWLGIVEINADKRIAAFVSFDPDDFDAAIAELDARYLAGEAAAHAHTWSVDREVYAALNRHELPSTTPDWVDIGPPASAQRSSRGDLTAYIRAVESTSRRTSTSTSRPCIG